MRNKKPQRIANIVISAPDARDRHFRPGKHLAINIHLRWASPNAWVSRPFRAVKEKANSLEFKPIAICIGLKGQDIIGTGTARSLT
jgi:hypothetical protein